MALKWYVYILECENGTFYTGLTDNLQRRFSEHASGKGGNYTERNRPEEMLYYETFDTRTSAEKREKQIKRWTRDKKNALIQGNIDKLRGLSVSKD